MNDRERGLERQIFRFLASHENVEGKRISLQETFNSLFKSNGLLTSAAFPNGRLVTVDELRQVVRRMVREGWLTQSDALNDLYYELTDNGIVELQARKSSESNFELSEDEVTDRRWARLKQITIKRDNAEQISTLLDRSLDELGKQQITNEQHRQAAAYLLAAKELVNAPAPPSDFVWDLVQKAAAIAGVAQIVLAIFAVLT